MAKFLRGKAKLAGRRFLQGLAAAGLLELTELGKILTSRKAFDAKTEEEKNNVGTFKIKKIRYLGPHLSGPKNDPNATDAATEARLAQVRAEIARLKPVTHPETDIKPDNWKCFLMGVPFTGIALAVVQHGMRFVFAKEIPKPKKACQMHELKGRALLVQLEDCLKWMRLKKFCGPFPLSKKTFNGETILLANTFCIPKPPKEDGTPQ